MPYPSTPEILEPKVFDRPMLRESQLYKYLLIRLYQGLNGSNKKNLADAIGMGTQQNEVGKHVETLKSMKLVKIKRDPIFHGKQHLIFLTRKGKHQARALVQGEADWFSAVSHMEKEVWLGNQEC